MGAYDAVMHESEVVGEALAREPGRLVRHARRASWNLVDQALSALTNFALSFIVARIVSAHGFGAFAIAFLVFSLVIGAERALIGQPLSIRYSGAEGDDMRRAVAAATATALALGITTGALAAIGGVIAGGAVASSLVAMAVMLPGLVLQDTCRMVFFAQRRPGMATINDALWTVAQAAFIAVVLLRDANTPAPFIIAWGLAAALSAVVGVLQLGVVPDGRRVISWIRDNASLSGYLLAEFILGNGAYQGGVLLVGALVGVGDIGSLRAAQILVAPLTILGIATTTFLLPEISRRTDMTSRRRFELGVGAAAVLAAIATVYSALLVAMPDRVGVDLLGDTWKGASSVLLATCVGSIAASACTGPGIVIYALGRARTTFFLHVVEAPLLVVLLVIGVSVDDTVGAAWGIAINFICMVPLWFWQLGRVVRQEGAALARSERASAAPAR